MLLCAHKYTHLDFGTVLFYVDNKKGTAPEMPSERHNQGQNLLVLFWVECVLRLDLVCLFLK